MLRRSSRSRSRGRAAPYQAGVTPSKSPGRNKKAEKVDKGSISLPIERNMAFEEGDIVMARWPGSKLFYNAKVQFVRIDDNEYDVEYENGVVFTIAAKDVIKQSGGIIRKPLHSRKSKSKSRARSTGRSRKSNKPVIEDMTTMGLIDSEADKSDSFIEQFEDVEAKIEMLSTKISNSSKLEKDKEENMISKKTSISSRVSSIKSSSSPKISNKSIEPEEMIISKKSSCNSRLSKKSSQSSNVSSKVVTANVSEANGDLSEDDTNVLSVSTRASKSSVVFDDTNNKDGLELELVDISDIVPVLKSSQSSKKQSISSRISGIIFGGDTDSEKPEKDTKPSRSSTVSLEVAVTDGFSEDEDLPPSVSARASRSSIVSGKATDREETNNLEFTDINESLPAKRSSKASIKQSISSRISGLLFGKEKDDKDSSSGSQKGTSVSVSSKLSMQPEDESEKLASSVEKGITEEVEEVEARVSSSSKYSDKSIEEKVSVARTADATDTTEDSFVPRRSSRILIKTSSNSKIIENPSPRAVRLDEYSEDELDGEEAGAVNPEYIGGSLEEKSKSIWNFEWIWSIFFMVLCPAILIFLHTLCTGDVCNLAIPKISINPMDYVDKDALLMVVGFSLVLRVLEFVCMGKLVQGYRMNGFQTLMLILASVPTLVYHKVPLLAFVSQKYFFLMSSCILLSYAQSLFSYLLCRFWSVSSSEEICSKGNSGNPLVDIFHGPAINPMFLGCSLKLQTFRFSMIGLALLNVCLVAESLMSTGQLYNPNPAMTIGACFQVLYAMDAMWFEEYYFYSHDSLYSGYGWSLISSYLTFPFLPTLITRYLVARQPPLGPMPLVGICLLNMLGYIIYRSSESQRCELAKAPESPNLDHLTTLKSGQGKKLIVSGWWGLVRHPNYLGELLIQWSWVLPAVSSLGMTELVPYYLPVVTTLMLLIRCIQINKRNRRKYGGAWDEYTRRVKSNIIPLIF